MAVQAGCRVGNGLRRSLPLLVVLSVPLFQIATSPSWLYNPWLPNHPNIDWWVYDGYFHRLRLHLQEFAGTYYGTRLAWILPGYFAYTLFPLLTANVLLRLFIYYTALLSAFAFLRRSYGQRCALMCCLLLSAYAYFYIAIGWDYVDGAGIAYTLFALEELGAAAVAMDAGRRNAAMLRGAIAGVGYAAALHTNMLLLVFFPVLAAYYLVRTHMESRQWVVLPAAVVGTMVCTAVLGLASLYFGGPFLFFMPTLSFIWRNAGQPNPWYRPVMSWLPSASWLLLPVLTCALSIFYLARWWLRRTQSFDREYRSIRWADASAIVFALALFTILHVMGFPLLQFEYNVSYLTPFVLLAAGAAIGRHLETMRARTYVLLAAGCALLALAIGSEAVGIRQGDFAPVWLHPALQQIGTLTPALVLLGMIATVFFAEFLKRGRIAIRLVGIGVGLVYLGFVLQMSRGERQYARTRYLDIHDTVRKLSGLCAGRRMLFWYAWRGPDEKYFTPIAASFLWEYRLIGKKLPDTSDVRTAAIPSGARIALLAPTDARIREAIERLARQGVELLPVAHWQVRNSWDEYEVAVIEVAGKRFE